MNLRRHQTLTLRLLAASAGILSAAAFAAPAQANPVDDAFIAALNNAGVNYGDPVDAKALGQSVCPILAEPGGSFNTAVASVVARAQGMSRGHGANLHQYRDFDVLPLGDGRRRQRQPAGPARHAGAARVLGVRGS